MRFSIASVLAVAVLVVTATVTLACVLPPAPGTYVLNEGYLDGTIVIGPSIGGGFTVTITLDDGTVIERRMQDSYDPETGCVMGWYSAGPPVLYMTPNPDGPGFKIQIGGIGAFIF